MFYLVIKNLGNDKCVSKSKTDNYVEGMQIECTNDITVPTNAVLKRSINVKCVGGSGVLIKGDIYQK